ncbi:hypothetical protein B0H17DRAFT_1185128 [Mycena rosella]|uniref:CxC2-like cysteine cluster KDZ transposase-associated domain-containing protein n=1 Tax=Mycena rosella TaxID=1033263 RepID=A0AAD7G5L6_MYCRO|nr:hypothetical protein B0H17DRAFT_1185128 [Mycena rosella]
MCVLGAMCCQDFLVRTHQSYPTHRIEEWEGAQLTTRTLQDLGLHVHLRHVGEHCPGPLPREIVLISMRGVHTIDVDFCTCENALSEDAQLRELGWYHPNPNTILQYADGQDTLKQLRCAWRQRRIVLYHWERHVQGQKESERTQAVIRKINAKIARQQHRYRDRLSHFASTMAKTAKEMELGLLVNNTFSGSSSARPWSLDQNSQLVLLGANGAQATGPAPAPWCIIYKGPPSTIVPHKRAPPAHASTGIRPRRCRGPSPAELGKREDQDVPLAEEHLYLDAVRPMVDENVVPKEHHKCGICHKIKLHPVSIWLQKKWMCPVCIKVIREAPFRHYGEEDSIESDYPAWHDSSRVAYRNCAPEPPAMWTHKPHTSQVVATLSDGRRGLGMPTIVNTSRQQPSYFQEDPATNAALEAEDFSYIMGDQSLPKYPLKAWMEFRDEYLDKMLRLEGRGNSISHATCALCGSDGPMFRCAQQLCHGPEMFCEACVVVKHVFLPTDWIEQWNGEYFERCSLYSLGLVVQLGHPPGFTCGTSTPTHKDFVVINLTGIHHVKLAFCECDSHISHRQQLMRVRLWPATVKKPQTCATFAVIQLFQIINCLGKVAAHNFIRSLELLTNNDGLTPPPVHSFLLFDSQRHPMLTKFATRIVVARSATLGNSPGGVHGTAQGELALRCRASLQPGRNLPDGWDRINWEEMPEDLWYKYFLFLTQDCNLRLINLDVSSAANNPIIGDGLGYFVNQEKYASFLRTHVSEEEISSCSGFQAMFLANRKRLKGLWTTGVVPNFHLPPHKPLCHSPFSFHWMWGAGRTHGETVEQNWEFTNGAAASTKMMGLGTWVSTLEDLLSFHNWRRLIHRDVFDAFNAALEEQAPELVANWKGWVAEWESRQHTDGTESSFEVAEKVTTMKKIHVRLAKEELVTSGEGEEVEREDTLSMFILMGLEIEESQRHLAIDVKAIANPTTLQDLDFFKQRTALTKHIRAFCKTQRAYMPHHALWDTEADRDTEAVRLFMPSDIADRVKRIKACAEGLPGGVLCLNNVRIHKAKLRYRYARNALLRLRENDDWERDLRVLEEDDVQVLNERALTEEERAQRETVHDLRDVEEGGVAAYGVVAQGEGRRTLSWIWYTAKVGEPTEQELVEGCSVALRVEWCKAYARMRRWDEDVVLVEEEMHRTIQYGYWEAGEWLQRSVAREGTVTPELEEGLKAYALEQTHHKAKTCEKLLGDWACVREWGRAYLTRETLPSDRMGTMNQPAVDDDEDDDAEDEEGTFLGRGCTAHGALRIWGHGTRRLPARSRGAGLGGSISGPQERTMRCTANRLHESRGAGLGESISGPRERAVQCTARLGSRVHADPLRESRGVGLGGSISGLRERAERPCESRGAGLGAHSVQRSAPGRGGAFLGRGWTWGHCNVATSFGAEAGDSGEGWGEHNSEEQEETDLVTGKKKCYASDDPNRAWRLLNQTFLDKMVRREGLGDSLADPWCSCCPADSPSPSTRLFRCEDCGMFLQCGNCILERHPLQPLHAVKEWKGGFWAEVTLLELRLVFQLGHGGLPCKQPKPACEMVVIHTNRLHIVNIRDCGTLQQRLIQ